VKYVLDTNTVSALMRADERVVARLRAINRRDVGLPQPVLAEIAYGIARLPKSKRRNLLQERLDLVAGTLERIEWTDSVSDAFGSIKATLERKGLRIEDFDVAIAAHALAVEATLVTDNTKDLARVPGLAVESWRAVP